MIVNSELKIMFQNHKGHLDFETNQCVFYGLFFDNISNAIKTLKDLEPNEIYRPWFYNFHSGIIHPNSGQIYIDNRWMPNDDFAEKYIDTKKNNL